jgi:hypothetical protein
VAPIEGNGAGTSSVIDKDGNQVEDVAFVLVSYGADRQFDATNSGYGTLDPLNGPFTITLDTANRPDFEVEPINEPDEDDIVLIVTYPELLAAIARSEQ